MLTKNQCCWKLVNNDCYYKSVIYFRYNGILADYWFNNHDLPKQVMSKFLADQLLSYIPWPEQEAGLISHLFHTHTTSGTVGSIGVDAKVQRRVALAVEWTDFLADYQILREANYISVSGRDRLIYLQSNDFERLQSMYHMMYKTAEIRVARRVRYISQVVYCGECFRNHRTDTMNCNVIQARWLLQTHPLRINSSEALPRAGVITGIILSNVTIGPQKMEHLLLHVNWYETHEHMYAYGHHVRMYHKRFCNSGNYSFMPIQRVISKCALSNIKHQNIGAVVIIPLSGQWALL